MHPISNELVDRYGSALIEPARMASGLWVVRIFEERLHTAIMLSVPDAKQIEREVYSLGAARLAARIRRARQSAQRTNGYAEREATSDDAPREGAGAE